VGLQTLRSLLSPGRTRFEAFQATEPRDRIARRTVFAADGACVAQALEFPKDAKIVKFPHARFVAQRYQFDLHMPYNRHHLAQPRLYVSMNNPISGS
jgi:hypothetical protein